LIASIKGASLGSRFTTERRRNDSIRVFVAYSNDTPRHVELVRELAARLRQDGFECAFDQFVKTPPEGWHAWTENQLASAQVTLVVCTEALHRQVELLTRQRAARGGSSDALGLLVDQWTRDPSRFRPVIPDGADEQWIPAALRSCTQFRYGSDYGDLLRHLESLSQPGALPLGTVSSRSSAHPAAAAPPTSEEQPDATAAAVAYARKIVALYEDQPVHSAYVRPAATNQNGERLPDLIAHVRQVLRDKPSAFVLLLGDYGSGKSAFSYRLTYELSRDLINDPSEALIPLYLNLSYARNKTSLLKALSLFVSRHGVALSERALRELMRVNARVVLVLDGLDEVANRTQGEDLQRMLGLFMDLRDLPGVRVVLTSRITFFRDNLDETQVPTTDRVVLAPFDDQQIDEYLERKNLLREAHELFARSPRLRELCRMAIHLFLCTEYLRDRQGGDEDFRPIDLYDSFVKKNLAINAPNHPGWSMADQRAIVAKLAYDLWSNELYEVTPGYFETLIADEHEAFSTIPASESARLAAQIINSGFFSRVGGRFRFLHLSFLEFFVSEVLVNDLYQGRLQRWARRPLYAEIFDFMIQFIQRRGVAGLPLRAVVESETEEVQSNFLATMYRWPVPEVRVVFETLLLAGRYDLVRCVACQGLGLYETPEVLPGLLRAFAAERNSVIRGVIQRLIDRVVATSPEAATAETAQALATQVVIQRADAARVLQHEKNSYALVAYRKALALGDRRWTSTMAAIYLLGAIADPESIDKIKTLGAESVHREVRQAAAEVSALIGAGGRAGRSGGA